MFNLDPQSDLEESDINKGLTYLLFDGISSQSMSSLASGAFIISFAILLGATNLMVGIIAAIPFLTNIAQLIAIWIIESTHKRKIVSVVSSFISRMSLILIALIPIFFDGFSITALLIFIGIMGIFASISSAAFNSWMRELIPKNIRGRYFAKRVRISIAVGSVLSIIAAMYVDGVITIYDTNIILKYSSIFVVAFVFGLMGIIFLSLVPEPKMKDNEHFNIKNIAKPFKDKRFKRLIMFIFVWSFACSLVTPFFVVYMLIRLGLPLSFVIGVTALSQIITVLLLPIWGNLIDKFGIKPVMRLGAIFYLIAIALWPYTTLPESYILTIPILLIIYSLMGFAAGGITLSTTIFVYKLSPEKGYVPYITANGVTISIAAGIAPLFGGAITDIISKMRFSITFNWVDSSHPLTIFLTDFQGLDFLFIMGFFIGLYSLYLLKNVFEEDAAADNIVRYELFYTIRRYIRTQFLHLPSLISKNGNLQFSLHSFIKTYNLSTTVSKKSKV